MSLVSFSNVAAVRATGVTNYSSFSSTVNSLKADGGTNWEDALQTANSIQLRSDADQYVIFVSDGNPTFRLTQGGGQGPENQRYYYDNYGHYVYGSGNSDNNGKNYKYALVQARNIVNSGKKLYTLNVYGDANEMAQLARDSGAVANFDAKNNDQVLAAFEAIVNQINANFSYKDCKISDGVTSLTSHVLLDGDADSFSYQISGGSYGDGQVWTDAPAASFTDGSVSWDLGGMQLEDGVTYTVSFRVWPSQSAYDLVSDLNNGLKTYDSLTDAEKKQIASIEGGYGLKTNTDASIDYTQLETLDTEHLPDGAQDNGDGTWSANGYTFTQLEDGTYHGVKESKGTDAIDQPDPIPLDKTQLTVRKVWTDDLDTSSRPDSITLKITRDDQTYIPVTLSAANNWESVIFIAPGLIAGGETLEDGHDYTIVEEGSNNHYEVAADVLHPMIVESVLQDSAGGDSELTVTNTLKGRLKISKTVTASEGLTAPDKEFSFKVTLTDKDGKDLDISSQKISYTITHKDGTVSQPAQLGQDGLIQLKDGESATIADIPSGSRYKVEEADLPKGFTQTQTTGNQGTITSDHVQEAAFTNNYAVEKTSADLGIAKSLIYTGDVWLPDMAGKFTFTLTAVTQGAPMPDTTVITNTDQKGSRASFGTITFTKPGTYQYKITESGTLAGVTNDAEAESGKLITVTVTDNGEGQLTAVPSEKDGLVTFINTYREGSLKIEKTLAGNDVDPQKEFSFTVRLTGYDVTGDIDGITFTKGVGSLTLKGGESKTLHHLPAGISYTVTEADYSKEGYTCSQPDGFTGLVENNTTKELTFVNTRNSFGSLTVSKTVTGNDADTGKAFSFTVELSDKTVTGTHGDMEFANGQASFTLKNGESKTAEDLPNGAAYTVSEADYSAEGYKTQSFGETGTITGNGTRNAKFVNSRDTFGSIRITKTVSGNDTDSSKSFEFTVTLSDKTINGTFGQMTFTDGVATVSLTAGSFVQADNLPNGLTFTVEEKDYSGEGYESSLTAPFAGTVKGNATVAVDVTNTRNTFGSLTVTKKVDGNDADSNKEFTFTVTLSDTTISGTYGQMKFINGAASFTLKDGESKTASDLPNGVTYTVTEADYSTDGYSASKTGDTGSIVGNAEADASFVNTRNTYGDLTVTKTVKGNDADTGKEFSFIVTLGDASISGQYGDMKFMAGKAQFMLKDGESVTAAKLPNGVTYTVTEADYSGDGYVTESEGAEGTIDDEKPATAAFTNTRDTYGDLTISKTVKGNDADTNKAFTFTVTLSDTTVSGTYGQMEFTNGKATFELKDGESKTASGLSNGVTYTVAEADYSADGNVTESTGAEGTIDDEKPATAAFINTRDTYGDLTVTKTVNGNDADANKAFTFIVTLSDTTITGTFGDMEFTNGKATFELKDGQSKTASGLPNGITYTVSEADYSGDGYVTESEGAEGTIDDEVPATAVFTNTRDTYGDLTVSKTVKGNDADTNKAFTFTVTLSDTTVSGTYGQMEFTNGKATFELKDGESKTASGLPNGVTYTVAEADYSADGYVTESTGAEGTIDDEVPATAVFVNSRDTYGSIKISKTVSGNDTDSSKSFEFTVTLSDKTINGTFGQMTFTDGVATVSLTAGSFVQADNLPNGLTFTVEEKDYSGEGYESSLTAPFTGVVKGNVAITVDVTNTRNTFGSLTVTKKVNGNDADPTKEFTFTVTLSDTTITGTFGDMEFTDGVATIELKDGESRTASGLPNGVTYTVTEADYSTDGYSASKTGDTGSIVGNAEADASFVNTRNTYGDLTVTKTVKGNDADTGKAFTFKVALSDTTITGLYGDMDFINGVASFELKNGHSKTASGLPNGVTYTVTENDYSSEGYVTESTDAEGTIDDEKPATAAFTNTRNKTVTYGSLTISKVVEGKEADLNQYFDFTVTFDKEGTYSYSGSKSGTITSGGTIQLKHGESITITGIESGTYYTVT